MTSLNSLSPPVDDPDPFDDDERPRSDPKAIVTLALARSWRWVVTLCLIGATIGLAAAVAKPNTYTSQAKLLLRFGAREEMTAEDIAVPGADRRESRPTMQDELHMLRDETIYEGVAERLGPELILRPADPSRDDGPDTPRPVRWMHDLQGFFISIADRPGRAGSDRNLSDAKLAGEVIVNNTSLTTERDSNVITVTHTSTSPERAQEVTDALTKAFIERHRSQFSIQSFLDQNRQKMLDVRNDYEDARKRYYEHVDQCKFVDIAVQGEALMNEIDLVERELFDARVRRDEIVSQRKALAAQLEQTPLEIETVIPPVVGPNPEYDVELSAKRSVIAARDALALGDQGLIGERHRREKEYDAQLTKMDEELALTPRTMITVPEQRLHAPNPEYPVLRRRIDDLDVEDQGLLTRTRKLDSHLKSQQGRLDQLAQCKNLHGMMEVSIETVKQTYTRLSERYASLEALSSIDIEGDTNLRVMQVANVPYEKDGPDRKKVIAMGIIGGAMAGAFVALLRQMLDRRLRYPSSIERELDIPVLAVVPEETALADHSLRRAS